jgi:7-cyano-7-deazaguanine synthase
VPDDQSPDEAVFLPGRNALLLIKAALWCQMHAIERLALAPLGTSPFADAQSGFFRDFEAALNCGDLLPLSIESPFQGLAKSAVMQLGCGLALERTWSCIAPREGLHCGQCNKCGERKAAFLSAGLHDRTRYSALNGSAAKLKRAAAP